MTEFQKGDRVRLRSLGHLGTVLFMLNTPNYGEIPAVGWDDDPETPDVCGPESLDLISRSEDGVVEHG